MGVGRSCWWVGCVLSVMGDEVVGGNQEEALREVVPGTYPVLSQELQVVHEVRRFSLGQEAFQLVLLRFTVQFRFSYIWVKKKPLF